MEINEILDWLEKANDLDMSEVIKAMIRRNSREHPDLEMVFLSLPRNDEEERKRLLLLAASLMNRESGNQSGK